MPIRKDFLQRRVRLQRLGDGRFGAGWASELRPNGLVVTVSLPSVLSTGDRVALDIFGHDEVAQTIASVVRTTGQTVELAFESDIRVYRPSPEEPRTPIPEVPARVSFEGTALAARVVDASPHGIGLVSVHRFPKGAVVGIQVLADEGAIEVTGEVRYCRSVKGPREEYRLGARIQPPTRLDSAKWSRLLATDPTEDAKGRAA
ncbi:MAG: PilZ domain-containing protein [Fimbriimonadaceae bacterium]|nr:PilZ domain-containing protein [Fimbriimonadaceae bacterium]